MPTLSPDPLIGAWFTALAVLFVVVVAVPLLRTLVAGILLAAAAITRRDGLREAGLRVMPRVAHLVGSLVIGTAAVAAPAMAAPIERADLTSIDLDRDAGVARIAAQQADPVTQSTTPAAEAGHAVPTHSTPAHTAEDSAESDRAAAQPYVVRSGDTLWDIADAHLDHATDAEITEAWKAIWRANRAVIGDDPGLILPGQQLELEVLA